MNLLVLKHKLFKETDIRWYNPRDAHIERLRGEAERFINSIGAEKLVTVAEDSELMGVTVWYREEDDTRPSKDAMPDL